MDINGLMMPIQMAQNTLGFTRFFAPWHTWSYTSPTYNWWLWAQLVANLTKAWNVTGQISAVSMAAPVWRDACNADEFRLTSSTELAGPLKGSACGLLVEEAKKSDATNIYIWKSVEIMTCYLACLITHCWLCGNDVFFRVWGILRHSFMSLGRSGFSTF